MDNIMSTFDLLPEDSGAHLLNEKIYSEKMKQLILLFLHQTRQKLILVSHDVANLMMLNSDPNKKF